MKKLFLAVSTMIFTGFLMKSYRKLREQQPETREEVYRRILSRAAHEAHRAAARPTVAKMDAISTPMDGGLVSAIDAVQQMAPGRFA